MIEPVAELPALLAARKAARGLIVKLADALEQGAALRRFDGILVLKDGRIAESGSFDELMEQKGYFYALYTVSAVSFTHEKAPLARKGEPFRVFRLILVISNRFGIAAEVADVFADGFQLAAQESHA